MLARLWNYTFNTGSSSKQAETTDSESFAMVDVQSVVQTDAQMGGHDDDTGTYSVANTIIIDDTITTQEGQSADEPVDYITGKYAGSVSLVFPATNNDINDFVERWRADTSTTWRINDNIAIYCRDDTVKIVITMSDGFILSQIYYDAKVFITELSAIVDASRCKDSDTSLIESGSESSVSQEAESLDDELEMSFPSTMSTGLDGMSADEQRRKLARLTKLRLAAGLPSDMMTPLEQTLFVATFFANESDGKYDDASSDASGDAVDCCRGECI